MRDLKLIAFDAEDLAVISAHMQDAVMKVGDMAFLPRQRRFAIVGNRFDWTTASASPGNGKNPELVRRQTALRFERVLDAKIQGIDLGKKSEVLNLLAIQFEPSAASEDPEGVVLLIFAGGGAVRLRVECIEAELKDLGPAWRAKAKPDHPASE